MADERLAAVEFVLVEPRYPGNVGAAARIMKNLGFARLTLVAPFCSPADEEARRLAVDARDVLEGARIAPSLDAALAGIATVVGTSRRMGKQRRPHFRLDEVAPRLAYLVDAGRAAIVFGREADGLTDAELDRCTHLAYIPTVEAYPAANLAQAVAIFAYEIARAIDARDPAPVPAPRPVGQADAPPEPVGPLAEHGAREAMYAHLEEALFAAGFLKEGQAEAMMRRLRRILSRAELSPGDVDVVRGIARRILWVARERTGGGGAG